MSGIVPTSYRRRLWPARVALVVAILALVALVAWPFYEQSQLPNYVPDDVEVPSVLEPSATPSPTPSVQSPPPVEVIKSSAPTVLYLPNASKKFEVKTKLLPLKCGREIPYPDSGPTMWRGFYCTDRGLPGTDTPHYGIITGHSTNYGETAMNSFYKQGEKLVGQRVYIKTEASGKKWLVYRFTAVYKIDKHKIGDATQIWGDGKTSTAGRMVFLTCQQIAPGVSSVQNFVAVAEFEGVKDA